MSFVAGLSGMLSLSRAMLEPFVNMRGYAPKEVPLGDLPSCSPKSGPFR